jgi:hypothetical protein
MKIVILHLFFGTILLAARVEYPGLRHLSRRLEALRSWPSHRNRLSQQ